MSTWAMGADKRTVLVTVKTYPNPSNTYDETVCTAGIDLNTQKFVRLYPVRFRHMDYDKWFSKYDVLEMTASRHKTDRRQDTYTPDPGSIHRVGHIETGSKRNRDWAERNRIVLPLVTTLETLMECARTKECSLGIVPMREVEFAAEADDADWTPDQLAILNRDQLFGRKLAPLEKVPWRFYFSFRCNDACKGHRLQFFDWEAYQLYRNMRDKYDEKAAVEKVLHKYNVDYGEKKKDLHMFVGTHFRWQHEFMAIGLYYPPRQAKQPSLDALLRD
ncbi:MAG: hypothetical protein HY876_03855 [Coriobacteriales bacterium]|nr:hypothetical protein [Coriobacteriales bacterium]